MNKQKAKEHTQINRVALGEYLLHCGPPKKVLFHFTSIPQRICTSPSAPQPTELFQMSPPCSSSVEACADPQHGDRLPPFSSSCSCFWQFVFSQENLGEGAGQTLRITVAFCSVLFCHKPVATLLLCKLSAFLSLS